MVVIEHNLDVIAAADCVIDLGPEGGDRGRAASWPGGRPEQVARAKASRTAPYLREHLRQKPQVPSRRSGAGAPYAGPVVQG